MPVDTVFTIGHGTRPIEELVECLLAARVESLVDVRRFPSSRRNPQFNKESLRRTLAQQSIGYVHALELGGRRRDEPGADLFSCIGDAAFRSYVARMRRPEWQRALTEALAEPAPCFMCAETLWLRCHRRFIADLLVARGYRVVHLVRPHEARPHALGEPAEVHEGRLVVCGEIVA